MGEGPHHPANGHLLLLQRCRQIVHRDTWDPSLGQLLYPCICATTPEPALEVAEQFVTVLRTIDERRKPVVLKEGVVEHVHEPLAEGVLGECNDDPAVHRLEVLEWDKRRLGGRCRPLGKDPAMAYHVAT